MKLNYWKEEKSDDITDYLTYILFLITLKIYRMDLKTTKALKKYLIRLLLFSC